MSSRQCGVYLSDGDSQGMKDGTETSEGAKSMEFDFWHVSKTTELLTVLHYVSYH